MALQCNPVQQKIPCIFTTGIQHEPSNKHAHQPFKVTASDILNPEVNQEDIASALVTEKVDGTCCLIQEFLGVPWLWARLDRKPTKSGEKKFQRYQASLKSSKDKEGQTELPPFQWDFKNDFKEVPAHWIPASGVNVMDGFPQPDSLGHTPGWLPVERKSRQYCWHLSAVDLDQSLGLVLGPAEESETEMVLTCVPLSELCGKTCELIGTNINGNPYGLGCKNRPLHALVVHGSIPLHCPSPLNGPELHKWFESCDCNQDKGSAVEGIVWHCPSGALFKLHRHHLNLPWPVQTPALSQKPIRVMVDAAKYGIDINSKSQFSRLALINGYVSEKLVQLHELLADER